MKKITALLLGTAMVLSLAACGSSASVSESTASSEASSSEAASSEASAETAGELTTVTPGKLTMSTNAAFPPYEMTDDNGNCVGIDIEVAEAIADKLGLELQVDDMDFDAALLAAQTGKMIGVQRGTTGDLYCSASVEDGGFGEENVTPYDNGLTAVQALLNGQVDCVVIDNAPAQEFVEANPGLKILDTEYANEDYAIGVAKGNTALLDAINGALEELQADGTVQSIVDKYITAE